MQGLTPGTVTSYQRAVSIFLEWLDFHGVVVEEGNGVDDMSVEFRNGPTAWRGKEVSKSNFPRFIGVTTQHIQVSQIKICKSKFV